MLLVTGITGHTGSYFLKRLIEEKYKGKIRCVVRENSNTKLIQNSNLDVELVVGDINEKNFINNIMRDVDTVLHIYNIHHSPNIVQSAIDNQVKRVILIHTTAIYSKFKEASAQYLKIESDVVELAKDKVAYTILRPSMIYGDMCDYNMSKFIKLVDKLKVFPLINSGKSLIQPVNAKDLGDAYYKVLMNPEITLNKHYDLSGDRPISVKESLEIISRKLHKETIFIPIPLGLGAFFAKLIKVFTIGKIDIVEKVLRMGEDRAYSNLSAKSDFSFTTISFEEGIEKEIREHKREINI